MDHKDRTLIVALIGGLLLLVGIPIGFLGPIEAYTFYLFSEGGRFAYPGFGFGSFMFGNIASQIVGYYIIAALLIPLGYGHLRARRWARTLSLALLWVWLVVGAPLAVLFFFILAASKDISVAFAITTMVLLALSYLVLPGAMIRFYRGRNVRLTFEVKDSNSYWIERLPMPILVLGALGLFAIVMLHIPILFNGLFPLMGHFASGRQGIELLTASIAVLICLTWATFNRWRWAWWGSLVYSALMTASLLVTLIRSSWAEILQVLDLPPREVEMLNGLPIQGYHLAILIGVPLILTLGLIVWARPYFRPDTGGSGR
jgi:hypothetical protein